MIVNRFLNSNPIFESLNLLRHEIKVVGPGVKSSHSFLLPSCPVQ
uniref:Phosphoribulokinase n=1 Tax=Rhizophora mucronata TaxID=61149 RepID=A0A2P2NTQ4_RHIMU